MCEWGTETKRASTRMNALMATVLLVHFSGMYSYFTVQTSRPTQQPTNQWAEEKLKHCGCSACDTAVPHNLSFPSHVPSIFTKLNVTSVSPLPVFLCFLPVSTLCWNAVNGALVPLYHWRCARISWLAISVALLLPRHCLVDALAPKCNRHIHTGVQRLHNLE